MPLALAAHRGSPPLQLVEVEQLVCCEPAGVGLQMTHWSTRSLARVARECGIAPALSHSKVAVILTHAELQPHRSRYWKTPTLDDDFRKKAAAILWCYERAYDLAERGEVVLCVDEKPNIQVLGRRSPTRFARPGLIERREFEYVRHGTVNFLSLLVVHAGTMWGWCLEKNDGACLRAILPQLLHPYRKARRVYLIWDGGSCHIAQQTRELLRSYCHVRVLVTPPHASWLNQAELLLRAFSARYLLRGDWKHRADFIAHLDASWPEYNRLYVHPFTWLWTQAKMHDWFERHRR
ncbi:IS630 family transposase [Pyxidicoccus xibeiensis]|uniref:IS630 family transposase n=1 Tax=Pyxidicoccus xibeiensis TaxID=2906759 RepID=UPI0020A702AA|nr:IS630 family transposase [Pyxidicoccus xibeiensis]MCP3143645.1 IS630 family transposase [Pyxidicoccus xibeiensis]